MIRLIIFIYIFIQDAFVNIAASYRSSHKILFIKHIEPYRWYLGRWRTWRTYYRALKRVPAYKEFVDSQCAETPKWQGLGLSLQDIPVMDKANYIKQYSIEQRSYNGKLPKRGVVIDESSGSSGTPTSWARGPYERFLVRMILQVVFSESTSNKQVFVINAFALGAWATGMNVSNALTDITMIKSTGPDIDKIISTLKEFGNGYSYVILGYPPFLKNLTDDNRIDLTKYDIIAGFGGEGMSENMRRYLLKYFKKVTGSYGASDLEINIAVETDLTIKLRNIIEQNEPLKKELIITDYGVLPMIFQYNPYDYVIETNDKGELLITIARKENINPRLRYNIHDRGHVLRLKDLRNTLAKHDTLDILDDIKLDMPLLFHYGRSDMSIDYYGANVTPDGVRQVLYSIPEIAKFMNTFKLITTEDDSHQKGMIIDIELIDGAKTSLIDKNEIEKLAITELGNINKDFYNAYKNTAPKNNQPKVAIHEFNTGPFKSSSKKLKNAYVESNLKYDKL